MSTIFSPTSGTTANWLASTWSDIQTSESSTSGIMGALQSSASSSSDSLSSFLSDTADNFATIAQSSVTNSSAFYAQLASQQQQARQKATLQKALDDLQSTQNEVKAKNVLDPIMFYADGSSIDTENNIYTSSDGTQYDTTTGLKYVDPTSIVSMADGSSLDTKNNVLTMADGTRIDTVTGLKLSATA